jgi:transposase
MRGSDERTGSLFSFVDLEERVPHRHPLRKIRQIVNEALASLDGEFARLYSSEGRPSIAPERLLRASLLQAFFSVRSERQLMEQLDYNLMFRCSSGSASTIPSGTRPSPRRTETGCSMPRWRRSSWPPSLLTAR